MSKVTCNLYVKNNLITSKVTSISKENCLRVTSMKKSNWLRVRASQGYTHKYGVLFHVGVHIELMFALKLGICFFFNLATESACRKPLLAHEIKPHSWPYKAEMSFINDHGSGTDLHRTRWCWQLIAADWYLKCLISRYLSWWCNERRARLL